VRSLNPRRGAKIALAFVLVFIPLTLGSPFVGPAGAKTSFPEFKAPVVDDAKVVPDDAEQRIDAELLDYQQRTGNQIAVAVVKTTGDAALEDYSIDLARKWGVGQKGKDNGVLVLIVYEEHKLRIDVGRGLEGQLTDLQSGRIIREQMAPRLRDGDVAGAIEAATQSIRVALGDTAATAPAPLVQAPPTTDTGFPFGAVIPVIFFVGISLLSGLGRRRRRFGWMSPLVYGALFSGGGSSSSGSSGGGFSGGGGGSFGGGGASGSW